MPKTVAAFLSKHDKKVFLPARVRETLATMLKKDGPEAHEYEAPFMKLAQVGPADIGWVRDQFMTHIVIPPTVSGKRDTRHVWFADPKVAARVRKLLEDNNG